MALDWSKPLCTKHDLPLIAQPRGTSLSGKRICATASMSKYPYEHEKIHTHWHYNDAGCCHVLGTPNDYDLVNYDPADGRERVALVTAR